MLLPFFDREQQDLWEKAIKEAKEFSGSSSPLKALLIKFEQAFADFKLHWLLFFG